MKNKTILLISPEGWGINFVSKHHYANYLAKHNTVYFLNPVTSSIINPFGNVNVKVEKLKDNLFQVNYQNILPRLNTLPKFVQHYIFKKQAQQIQKSLQINKFDIVWSFDPYRFWNQNVWQADKTIYHAVDPHKAFYESNIITSSNKVFVVSNVLKNKFTSISTNIYKIEHGFNVDEIQNKYEFNVDKDKKNIGYVGNLNGTLIDKEMFKKIILELQENNFYFLGPYCRSNLSDNTETDWVRFLKRQKNVFLLGEKKSEYISFFLSKMDVLLLCYLPLNKGNTPHKVLEFLYSGKQIVSNAIIDYKQISNLITFNISNSTDEFISLLKEALHSKPNFELSKKRKQYAIQNSYDNKIEEISKLLYSN